MQLIRYTEREFDDLLLDPSLVSSQTISRKEKLEKKTGLDIYEAVTDISDLGVHPSVSDEILDV